MDELPSCYSKVTRTARKEHRCFGCGSKIRKKQKYLNTSGIWSSEPRSFKHCEDCEKILTNYQDFDSCLASDEGPTLDLGGIKEFMQGYLSIYWSGKEAVDEVSAIFNVSHHYASLILGYND